MGEEEGIDIGGFGHTDAISDLLLNVAEVTGCLVFWVITWPESSSVCVISSVVSERRAVLASDIIPYLIPVLSRNRPDDSSCKSVISHFILAFEFFFPRRIN